MKTLLVALLPPVAVLLLVLAPRTPSSGQDAARPKPPPLSLEGLLDEKLPEPPRRPLRMKVDNSSCYVCHDNYREELLVVSHGKEEIGCVYCHGESVDHRNDEDNATPPDVMFPQTAIEMQCRDCHDEHDVEAWKLVDRWQLRCPQKTSVEEIVCTDCHFQHRLERRVVEWNKITGELLRREDPAQPSAASAE
jgi:hypothetical protein